MSKHRPADMTCGNCAFWEGDDGAGGDAVFGDCRKSPPSCAPSVNLTVWRQTRDSDWCGEQLPDEDEVLVALLATRLRVIADALITVKSLAEGAKE